MKNIDTLKYKEKLLRERKEITKTIEDMNKNGLGLSQREESDELSIYDNHPGDMASDMYDKGRRYALVANEKDLLFQIDNALERIEENRYGDCELCGKEIPEERLDFLPYATTCMECESKRPDYTTYKYDRPVEEEVLRPYGTYFRDAFENDENDLAYDAEDSWQDVGKYNRRPHTISILDDEVGNPEEDEGIVELTDKISNQQYRDQLP